MYKMEYEKDIIWKILNDKEYRHRSSLKRLEVLKEQDGVTDEEYKDIVTMITSN